jgi:hypothetical protein
MPDGVQRHPPGVGVSVIVFEEDENTLPHFKDILLTVISKVCGYTGPEPGANKQYIFVRDQRQLGGIELRGRG